MDRIGSSRSELDLSSSADTSPAIGVTLVVRGLIDGRPTVARWQQGSVEAEPEVIRRAEVVVALGEHDYSSGRLVRASLQDDLGSAVIALMRALSRVTEVEVLLREVPWEGQ